MVYVGLLRDHQMSEVRAALESEVYKHWDQSSEAPPKERPATTTAPLSQSGLGLELLAVSNNRPVFPLDMILQRFPQDAAERATVTKLKQEFDAEFGGGGPAASHAASEAAGPIRASGVCDFSIDEGLCPLDLSRDVDLAATPLADFQEKRRE